jgi:regulator of sigma E protease
VNVLHVLLAILGLSVLMIVHEGGHYLIARAFKMRVLRFSIGFGPTIVRYQPKGSPTIFQVGLIPFLAYVQIAGMNPHEEVEPDDPEIFPNKSLLARILTIGGGPLANYLAASLIAFGLALTSWPLFEMPMVGEAIEGTPAAQAGLQRGDVIVEANGEPIAWFSELKDATTDRVGRPTDYVIERDGRRFSVTLTPVPREGNPESGVIGIVPELERYGSYDVPQAARLAITWPYEKTVEQITGIGEMIRQRTMQGLGGPVTMAHSFAQAAEAGPVTYLMFFAWISAALGFFNLLPFPALDGGRLCFLLYEAITRRRANDRVEAAIHTAGILFLLGLMVVVTYRDVVRIFE